MKKTRPIFSTAEIAGIISPDAATKADNRAGDADIIFRIPGMRRTGVAAAAVAHSAGSSLEWALATALGRSGRGDADRRPGPGCDVAKAGRGASAWLPQVLQACAGLEDVATPRLLALPEDGLLPLLCRTESRGWGVVTARTASGLWLTRFESGDLAMAEIALRGSCFLVRCAAVQPQPWQVDEPSMAPAAAAAAPSGRRSSFLAAAACVPTLPLTWESMGLLALVLLAVLAVLQFCRHALRSVRTGRGRFVSRWIESSRLSRQRERILRQAIRSNQVSPLHRQAPRRRDESRST